jgi:hypothetical protein
LVGASIVDASDGGCVSSTPNTTLQPFVTRIDAIHQRITLHHTSNRQLGGPETGSSLLAETHARRVLAKWQFDEPLPLVRVGPTRAHTSRELTRGTLAAKSPVMRDDERSSLETLFLDSLLRVQGAGGPKDEIWELPGGYKVILPKNAPPELHQRIANLMAQYYRGMAAINQFNDYARSAQRSLK